ITEGVGFGVLAQAIEELRGKKLPPSQGRERLAELVLRSEPATLDIRIDESLHSGTFALFEVTIIPLIGPNLFAVPAADPSDKLDAFCFAPAAPRDRQRLSEWCAEGATRAFSPLSTLVAPRVSIPGRFCRVRLDDDIRLDDAAGSRTIKLASEKDPLSLVVP